MPDDELPASYSCVFVPIFKLPTEYIKWIPKADQKPGELAWEWKTLDAEDPRVREGIWAPRGTFKGNKPPVTENINFLGTVLDLDGSVIAPFIIATFARTSFNTGKDLVTAMQSHGMSGLKPWGRCYHLYTKKESKEVGGTTSVYYVMRIAKGPALADFSPKAEPALAQLALWLADPEEGRQRQENMINRSILGDEAVDEVDADGNPVAATTKLDDEDNPFE